MRELRAGSNFQSQDPMRQHFGLGEATQADEVRVVWPDGATSASTHVAAGQTLLISASVQ
jgi:hypothetical protein